MHVVDIIADWPFAVVWLRNTETGRETAVAAAFVFGTRDGFAFVEPAYLDPDDVGHRFHRVRAAVDGSVDAPDVLRFEGDVWVGRIERYTGDIAQRVMVGECLERFEAYLQERKGARTLAEERARLMRDLVDDLA